MKTHTTNYIDTFITVADDTKAASGTIPPSRGDKKTIAEMQYELLAQNPYKFSSDDVLFQVFADRNDLTEAEYEQARKHFFSKGQPCFRASPLTKTYGFGVHYDNQGKMAIYGMETQDYEKFVADKQLKHVKAMKSSK
ncbi:hypothetical protein FXV77_18170 [Sphingobacterium phlebotomi]|uniref:Uncharacterized protein n=1 Tax=Sphingobacterium phlebotomi TaxID=2605433 RepID=A0A5D4GXR8_9SPHI|nr:DUF6157 family protein [Sphingobacterium phlebotomi]TYR32964.1 hypothetical protein FXV77_18170 [Sphingobacterium phlebotomi]